MAVLLTELCNESEEAPVVIFAFHSLSPAFSYHFMEVCKPACESRCVGYQRRTREQAIVIILYYVMASFRKFPFSHSQDKDKNR